MHFCCLSHSVVALYNCHPRKITQYISFHSRNKYLLNIYDVSGRHCCCSVTKSHPTLCDPMDCSTPGFPVLHYLPQLAPTLVHLVSDAIQPILCCPFLLPSIFPSIRVFSSELAFHIKGPKYWSFSISPSSEYFGLIFFRNDWFDLCAVPGTLKSLRQHPSSKASILWCSVFFMVQLSHPYMTTRKTIALTR